MVQHGGFLNFSECRAFEGFGGGLHVRHSSVQMSSGAMVFTRCSTEAFGGGFYSGKDVEANGSMKFDGCKATGEGHAGGGLSVFSAEGSIATTSLTSGAVKMQDFGCENGSCHDEISSSKVSMTSLRQCT